MTLLGSGVVTETVGEALLEWGGPPIQSALEEERPREEMALADPDAENTACEGMGRGHGDRPQAERCREQGPPPARSWPGPLQSPRRSHPAGRGLQTPGPQDWEGANSCRPHRGPVALGCASGPELARPAPAIRARLRRWREGTGHWPSERAARGHAQRLGSCPSGRKAVTWPRLAARAPGDRSI